MYSSCLRRAIFGARRVAETRGLLVRQDERFNEIFRGRWVTESARACIFYEKQFLLRVCSERYRSLNTWLSKLGCTTVFYILFCFFVF